MVFKGLSRGTMGEASFGVTAVPTSFIYSGLEPNPDVCGKNPTTDRLRRGTGLHACDKRVFILFCFVVIYIFKIIFLVWFPSSFQITAIRPSFIFMIYI